MMFLQQAFQRATGPLRVRYLNENSKINSLDFRAVAVAQLVERSLQAPEICSSNPDIGKILSTNCTIEKTKINK